MPDTRVDGKEVAKSDADIMAIKAKTDLIPADVSTQLDTNVPAIKAKTDNLPSDPADESAVEAAITAAHTTTNSKIDTVDGVVDAIKAKTDALPTDPADESSLEAAITSAHTTTNSKIDTVDGVVDAIKLKTDALPTTPADEATLTAMKGTGWSTQTLKVINDAIAALNNITAASVWSVVTRALTDKAGFTISGTKTTLDALNDITAANVLAQIQAEAGVFSGQTNLKTILAALGIPDTSGKPLYTCLITDRLDNGTYGLAALNTKIGAIDTVVDTVQVQTDKMPQIASYVDYWSLPLQITITSAAGDKGLVDIVVSGPPTDINIVAVQGLFMCDTVQNSATGTTNYLESTAIQVMKKVGGTARAAITLEANKTFRFTTDMIRGGTVFVADWATATAAGILAEVNANTTYQMWFDLAEALANNLVLDGAAFGLRIWYTL